MHVEKEEGEKIISTMTYFSSHNGDLSTIAVVVFCIGAAYWWLAAQVKSRKKIANDELEDRDRSFSQIPTPPGEVPLLGHALKYRQDPPGFLVRTRRECGPIFQLNLAGKKMILVCGQEEQRQLANAPESIMSLRKAVGAIGFEQTLGYKNVHKGTNIHKGVVKKMWHGSNGSSPIDEQLKEWQQSLRQAIESELILPNPTNNKKVDFFHLLRRVMLRATIDMFVGKAFLQDWVSYNFLKEFMDFQDTLEDVTAKVVVVPRWLSLLAMLWPLQRRREKLQLVIKNRLQCVLQEKGNHHNDTKNGSPDIGFWLSTLLDKKIPLSDISEYVVGLLFAAHKNPAIGAAQSYLLLQEFGSKNLRAQCQKEAMLLVSPRAPIKWSQFKSSSPTLHRVCLESLRLTAHSIGGVRTAQKDLTISVKDSVDGNTNGKETVYKIPEGSSVGFAHITSSLDKSIWGEDASSFDTDLSRYSEELYMDDYKFTAFSHGTHKCPGRELAMIQLKMTVALLLTEYEVMLPDKISPLDFERATLAQREGAVMVIINRRCK